MACPTEACEGGRRSLRSPVAQMPSASACRKSQEKPREIMDAAEVGFLLPWAWEDRPLGRTALREGVW